MKSSPILKLNDTNVHYIHDINPSSKVWEVLELPSKNVIITYNFEEEAEESASRLNEIKPFGDKGFPKFLTYKYY